MREYKTDQACICLPVKINNRLRSTFRIKTHILLQRITIHCMYRHSKTGLQSGHKLDAHPVSPRWNEYIFFYHCLFHYMLGGK